MKYPNGRILVFARTPVLGEVKTRLQPELGEQGCLELHQALVVNAVSTAYESKLAPVEVWHTGKGSHPFWFQLQQKYEIEFSEQSGEDLGQRMLQAASSHLSAADSNELDWMIIVGSDCPEIDDEYLAGAAARLEAGEDIVIGPAEDGGYVLVGLRRAFGFLFADIDWGTERVLSQTLKAADDKNCQVRQLKILRDLDDFSDYQHFQARYSWTDSYRF